jgi:hypothetical protein
MHYVWKAQTPKWKEPHSYAVIKPFAVLWSHTTHQLKILMKDCWLIAIGFPFEKPSFVRKNNGWRVAFGLMSFQTWGYYKKS